jgi:hypothetical protein
MSYSPTEKLASTVTPKALSGVLALVLPDDLVAPPLLKGPALDRGILQGSGSKYSTSLAH